jgi:tetratricopeptide (TPR) repeat protein
MHAAQPPSVEAQTSAQQAAREAANKEYTLGTQLSAQGKVKEAVAQYTKAIELDPSFPHPYFNRGILRRVLKDLTGAKEDLDRVIQLMPEQGDPYEARAFVEEEQGQFDAAIADLTKAISIDPKAARLYAGRAWMHVRKGDFAGAEPDVQKTLSLDPKNEQALFIRRRINAKDSSAIELRPSGVFAPPSFAVTKRQTELRNVKPNPELRP